MWDTRHQQGGRMSAAAAASCDGSAVVVTAGEAAAGEDAPVTSQFGPRTKAGATERSPAPQQVLAEFPDGWDHFIPGIKILESQTDGWDHFIPDYRGGQYFKVMYHAKDQKCCSVAIHVHIDTQ